MNIIIENDTILDGGALPGEITFDTFNLSKRKSVHKVHLKIYSNF